MSVGFPIQPCPSGCLHPTADQPCGAFVSQGYGPEGDFEHSLFCASCGWEYADHTDDEDLLPERNQL